MELSHQQTRALIQKALQARLDVFEQSAVEKHLTNCASCAAYQEEQFAVHDRLARSLPERWPAPRYSPLEVGRKLAGIQTHMRRNQMNKRALSFLKLAGSVATVILVIVGLAWLVRGTGFQPQVGSQDAPVETATQPNTVTPSIIENSASIELTYFWLEGCPHCAQMKVFLDDLIQRYPQVKVTAYQVGGFENNQAALEEAARQVNYEPKGTPFVVMGSRYWEGFVNTTAQEIETAVAEQVVLNYKKSMNPDLNPGATLPLVSNFESDILERLGARVFKVREGNWQYETYLIRQGQVWQLGSSFGGTGVSETMVTDLDQNSRAELVFLYHFGSGISRTEIGIFVPTPDGGRISATGFEDFSLNLALVPVDEQRVVVEAYHGETEVPDPVQFLKLEDGAVGMTTELPGLTYYENYEYILSFYTPQGWQETASGKREGPDGFVEVRAYTLAADSNGIEWACAELIAQNPALYGENPQAGAFGPRQKGCFLIPGVGAQEGALVMEAPGGKAVMIRIDPTHLGLVKATLRVGASYISALPVGTPAPGMVQYEVEVGDTCLRIALNYGISVDDLKQINGLSSDCLVSVGQILQVPAPAGTPED